jgi:soluble lytic murein transglycosylase-like protein
MLPDGSKRLLLGATWGVALLLLTQSAAAGYFIYKENDGTKWFTDRPLPKEKYTLIATVGRATASSSCAGITHATLQQRALAHAAIIDQYSSLHQVDARLIKAIISTESCFDRFAVSRVGAKGMMQLMPATAEQMRVQDVFNADDNIRAGTQYFSEMLTRFGQDIELALAAYNAGPGAVEKYKGVPPYKETQNYIERVLSSYKQYAY